jgi:Ca-activated chloride channel family protein
MEQADGDFRFAAAVAGFGQLLRGGKYTGDWSYPELIELARSSRGADDDGYRAELVALVELSRDLAGEPEA